MIAIYFAIVVFIGFYLRGSSNTSEEFFMAGREMTAWIAGLSFVSANLGSLELMGWAGSTYQYGILAMHWYWIGAIPAMLFLGIVMMPFYYISKTHSVPGYLKLRYGDGARALSAVSFAFMTILMSGINMYSMAIVMKVVLGWDLNFSIWVSSVTVAVYVALGGLKSAIYNEILQFLLIWAGALLVPILGLIEVGGWSNLRQQIATNLGRSDYVHLWSTLGHFSTNPMGVNWFGIVFGLGFVVSFGYWTTDFLVVQRVLSADSIRSARMAPVIGAAFKMAVPFIVILPGLLALSVLPFHLVAQDVAVTTGQHSFNEVLPLMLVRYCGPGLLGLGVTALIAGFMSGMAGNVSAFSTVWTYDIYGAFLNKKATDRHYVAMGRWSTLIGVLVSVGTAYLVQHAASIMDYVQQLFSFFIAPLFGTVILGMLWKRATKEAGFLGVAGGYGHVHQPLAVGAARSACLALRGPFPRRQRYGGECLSRSVGVAGLRAGYGGGQLHDQTSAGGGTGGAGLRRFRTSQGTRRPLVPASDCVGGRQWLWSSSSSTSFSGKEPGRCESPFLSGGLRAYCCWLMAW